MEGTNKSGPIQRVDEWEKIDEIAYKYHATQWDTPKRSTLAFERFASAHIASSKNIIDMGAGAAAATAFLATKFPDVEFTAFDYSEELTSLGVKMASERQLRNIQFERGDWFEINHANKFDGCISLQTLSWLPDYEQPLRVIFEKIRPNWIGITSLFYEGDITCRIEVEEYTKEKKSFYNVFSIPDVRRFCEKMGYKLTKIMPFEIDIDIEKPHNLDSMSTYTRRIVLNDQRKVERIQVSGPLLMHWHMLLIEKQPCPT